MKSKLMASVAATILTIGIGAPAFAATCSDEIAALKSETFTGSVNSADATAKPMAPAIDQSSAAAEPAIAPAQGGAANQAAATGAATDQNAPAGMASDQMAAANSAASGNALSSTGSLSPPAGTLPGTEATAAMNKATEGIAASPAEVDTQQTAQPAETAPSAEQVASADQPLPATTSPTSGGKPVDLRADMLARAEAYQKLGNDGACLSVVEQAKTVQ
jgi:hypothetical protein